MNRRSLFQIASSSMLALALGARLVRAEESFEITKSAEEWKKILTPEQFATLREEATEWLQADLTGPVNEWDSGFDAAVFSCEAAEAQGALPGKPKPRRRRV